jgi:hypothetical protein
MRTRLVMVGAFIGALILLSMSMLLSWPVSVRGAQSSAEEEATEALEALDSPVGTCLDWPADATRTMRRVDCALPHMFEVTSLVDITGDYGPDAPAPDQQGWQDIATRRCTEGTTTYLGGNLDPNGKYTVGALKPTDEQWRDGDRKLRCGLEHVTVMGTLTKTTGTARGQDQSNVHEAGTCFGLANNAPVDPVDCSTAHSYEVVGNVDLGPVFPAEAPNPTQQGEKLAELCAQVASQYTGGVDLAAKKLSLYWDTLTPESWAAGSHRVNCKVGAKLEDGAGLAPVTGSVRGIGAPLPPVPPPPTATTGG